MVRSYDRLILLFEVTDSVVVPDIPVDHGTLSRYLHGSPMNSRQNVSGNYNFSRPARDDQFTPQRCEVSRFSSY